VRAYRPVHHSTKDPTPFQHSAEREGHHILVHVGYAGADVTPSASRQRHNSGPTRKWPVVREMLGAGEALAGSSRPFGPRYAGRLLLHDRGIRSKISPPSQQI